MDCFLASIWFRWYKELLFYFSNSYDSSFLDPGWKAIRREKEKTNSSFSFFGTFSGKAWIEAEQAKSCLSLNVFTHGQETMENGNWS